MCKKKLGMFLIGTTFIVCSCVDNTYDIANKEVQLTMNNARAELEKKQHFVGALDFLNSQATISLVKKQGKRFEALT